MSARERKELAALEKMPDSAIDTRDIAELTDWSKAAVTIRLDIRLIQGDGAAIPDRSETRCCSIM